MSNKNASFEENMARLEQIVQLIEKGDISLEESLKLFQEGVELSGHCGKLLDEAEQLVKVIAPGPDGNPQEVDFPNE
jgi:exodeoxyribonuclease VII small subunit